jgi:hypothetical protein
VKNPRGPLSVKQLDAAVDLIGRHGRVAVLPVTGDSMLPSLRAGQRIAVELLPGEPQRGDLLVFRQLDYLVVHRFLGPASREDDRPSLRTRGDHIPALDPVVERSRVRGRVIAFEDAGRWWGLDTGAARAWALAVAIHDLFWAAAGAVASRLDGRSRRLGLPLSLARWTTAVDRAALGLAYRLLFRALHADDRERPEEFRGRGHDRRAIRGEP